MLQTFGHPVAICCMVVDQNVQIFRATFLDVAWCCTRGPRSCLTFVQRSVQHCWTGACALVWSAPSNMLQQGGQTYACNMLYTTMSRYVACVWPAPSQHDPTMLHYIVACVPGPLLCLIYNLVFLLGMCAKSRIFAVLSLLSREKQTLMPSILTFENTLCSVLK